MEEGPNVTFTMTDDLGVTPDLNSGLVLRIGHVDEEYIEGSFEATGFVMVSMTQDETSIVGVTGDFRARLQMQ